MHTCIHTCLLRQVPSGIRCRTCPIRDDYFCPVSIAINGVREYIPWETACLPDGQTQGTHCCFCTKDFYGRIRRSRIPFVTISQYEEQLGSSVQLLQSHQTLIVSLIKKIIASGGKMNIHVNWGDLEKESLKVKVNKNMECAEPGFEFHKNDDYKLLFGDLEVNGFLAKGHRQWKHKGEDGVLVPEKGPVRIKFTDVISAEHQIEIASTADGSSSGQLARLQNSLANSFWNESSGGIEGAVRQMADPDKEDAASGFSFNLTDFVGQAPSSGERNGQANLAQQEASQLTQTPKRSPAQGARQSSAVPATKLAPAPKLSSRPKPPTKGAAPPSSLAANALGKKGRPARNWEGETNEELTAFRQSLPTDPLWWGADAPTKIKDLAMKRKELDAKIKTLCDMTESTILRKHSKALSTMLEVVQAVHKHGVSSDEFHTIYDHMTTQLALPPAVEVEFPDHIKREHQLRDISSNGDADSWLRSTTSTALLANGVSDVEEEQIALWCEKMSVTFRTIQDKSPNDVVKALFSVDRDYNLEPRVNEFVSNIAVVAAWSDFEDLSERIELLTESFTVLDAKHLPNAKRGVVGSLLGGTFTGELPGQRIIADGRMALARAQVTQEVLEPFLDAVSSLRSSVLGKLAEGKSLLETGDAFEQEVVDKIRNIHDTFTKDFHKVLPEWRSILTK